MWTYFTIIPNANKAKCDICKAQLSTTGGSTNNLTRHLRLRHPTINLKVARIDNDANAPSSLENSEKTVIISQSQPRNNSDLKVKYINALTL